MFLRLVILCRLTCLYPLLCFSVYRHGYEEVAGQHGPCCGIRIPYIC